MTVTVTQAVTVNGCGCVCYCDCDVFIVILLSPPRINVFPVEVVLIVVELVESATSCSSSTNRSLFVVDKIRE